jgi:hypothetical protein
LGWNLITHPNEWSYRRELFTLQVGHEIFIGFGKETDLAEYKVKCTEKSVFPR